MDVNTVQILAYTPEGFRVYVTIPLQDANEIDSFLQGKNYLANSEGSKMGEDVETVSHVALRIQDNNGEKTPHIAFYPENEMMEWSWVRPYLNTEKDVAEFESATGLRLSSLPVYPADNHPKRKPANMKFIIKLPRNIKISRKQVTKGVNDDGTPKLRNYFERYLSTPKTKTDGGSDDQLSEGAFKRKLMELTHHSYTDSEGVFNQFAQQNSLKKAFAENEINLGMDVNTAAKIINTRKAL